MELLSPFLFSSKNNFMCWSWISSSWPKAVTYLLKEKKTIMRLIYKFFSPRLSIQSKHLQESSSFVEGSPVTAMEQVKRIWI